MQLPGKRVRDSQLTLAQMMQPPDANSLGHVHGGNILKMVDEAGGIVAARHSGHPAVTVRLDSMTFEAPVYVGNLVTVDAYMTYAGHTSMEIATRVMAEDIVTGQKTQTSTGYAVYVALGPDGRPAPVPPLILETDEERQRFTEAQKRQQERLARRQAPHP